MDVVDIHPANNENTERCRECGGSCCKGNPGACLPSDFGEPFDPILLRNALCSGRYCLDWWEGDIEGLPSPRDRHWYVRPTYQGSEGKTLCGGWGGRCTFLTDAGCSLTFDRRPWGCRFLVPSKNDDEDCVMEDPSDKEFSVRAWNAVDIEGFVESEGIRFYPT